MDWIQISPQLLGSFPPDSRYLVGVSGGRDSIALLRRLLDLGYRKLIVCHLNHQLRGRSSNADAGFVQELVAKYNGKIVCQPSRKIVGQALRLSATGDEASDALALQFESTEHAIMSALPRVFLPNAAPDL